MKSIITAMLAAASMIGVASAAAGTATIPDSTVTEGYNYVSLDTVSSGNSGAGAGYNLTGTIDQIGVDYTIATSLANTGRVYTAEAVNSWTNTTALASMVADLGYSTDDATLTTFASYLSKYSYNGYGSGITTIVLDFADSDLSVSDEVTIYLAVTQYTDSATVLSSLTVTGLSNVSASTALNGSESGDFASAATSTSESGTTTISGGFSSTMGEITLVKITGTLTSTEVDVATTSTVKLGTAFIGVVPEPATATLSLLALAGLAARRRRK